MTHHVKLTSGQREEISWILAETTRAGSLMDNPRTRNLAEVLLARVHGHAEASFPDEFQQAADFRDRRERRAEERMKMKGPPLWSILHSRALLPAPVGEKARHLEVEWLNRFADRVSSELCGACGSHMKGYMGSLPPDFDNYFEWTVEYHNVVNARRQAPKIEVEEARAIHSKPQG